MKSNQRQLEEFQMLSKKKKSKKQKNQTELAKGGEGEKGSGKEQSHKFMGLAFYHAYSGGHISGLAFVPEAVQVIIRIWNIAKKGEKAPSVQPL